MPSYGHQSSMRSPALGRRGECHTHSQSAWLHPHMSPLHCVVHTHTLTLTLSPSHTLTLCTGIGAVHDPHNSRPGSLLPGGGAGTSRELSHNELMFSYGLHMCSLLSHYVNHHHYLALCMTYITGYQCVCYVCEIFCKLQGSVCT